MSFTDVFALAAGIGMFLYGMDLMGNGLKNAAGASMESILHELTNNRWKGLALGTGVTAVIQSSAATVLMCLGFVNAGVMSVFQAIPVAFGANIGSTVTGQILRLGDISNENFVLTLLKPASMGAIMIVYSVIILVFVKSRRKRLNDIATVLMGLGILFIGMSMMENAISPLRESESFQKAFLLFSNPLIGILIGIGITALIQSSSASVGILQALTSTGQVTWGVAVPIILGQNIGKCFTVFLGSLKTSRDSKRVAFCHFFFNVAGAVIIGGVLYGWKALFGISWWNNVVDRGNVADFHTLFNLITALILLPFSNAIGRLSQKVLPDKAQEAERHRLDQLDDLLLKTPPVALEAARKVALNMGEAAKQNFDVTCSLLSNMSPNLIHILEENEDFLDKAESRISDYIVKINTKSLDVSGNRSINEILRCVTDFERIGDYCINIYEMLEYNHDNQITFSKACVKEIQGMNNAVRGILSVTLEAFQSGSLAAASKVEPLEEVIDSLTELIRARHIERLKNNTCSVQAGISLLEYLNSTERISDHCSNIAVAVIRSASTEAYFDTHRYLNNMHAAETTEYNALYQYYESQYYEPVNQIPLQYDEDEAKAAAAEKAGAETAAGKAEEETFKAKKSKAKTKEKDRDKEKGKEKPKVKEKDKEKQKDQEKKNQAAEITDATSQSGESDAVTRIPQAAPVSENPTENPSENPTDNPKDYPLQTVPQAAGAEDLESVRQETEEKENVSDKGTGKPKPKESKEKDKNRKKKK